MVYTIPDLYVKGGLFQGYLYFPNLESLLQFTKKDLYGNIMYECVPFDNNKLTIIEFPAYFRLGGNGKWIRYDSVEEIKPWIEKDLAFYKEKVKMLEVFLKDIEGE